MYYQLPNGKVLHLSVEEYLNMDDQELHQLAHSESGMSMNFSTGSDDSVEDKSLDYTPDKEDTSTEGPLDINALPDS